MAKYFKIYNCIGWEYNPITGEDDPIYNGFSFMPAASKEEAENIVNADYDNDSYWEGRSVWADAVEISEAEYRYMTSRA